MGGMIRIGLACAAAALVVAAPAGAQTAERSRRDAVAVFAMAKADSRLPRIPDRLITARLDIDPAYLVSVAGSHVVVPSFSFLRGASLELEAQYLQHVRGQTNGEVTAAAVLRSPELGLFGGTSANVAWGNGLSHAIGRPRLEQGRGGVRGVDTVRTQYHMSFELELSDTSEPDVHLVFRLHHRSGIYGLISPDYTGSNYVGAGLRFDLH
jgi:hypothetical protein